MTGLMIEITRDDETALTSAAQAALRSSITRPVASASLYQAGRRPRPDHVWL
jgi:hypothetical protein